MSVAVSSPLSALIASSSVGAITSTFNFVQHIEDNIYSKALVYRSILVAKSEKESQLLKRQLDKKDYSAIIINTIDSELHYNNIDNRIVIVSHDKFRKFIEHLDMYEGGILESTYNFIAFSWLLDKEIVNELVDYYIKKTNNNMNNTIILDTNYENFIYLQKCLS